MSKRKSTSRVMYTEDGPFLILITIASVLATVAFAMCMTAILIGNDTLGGVGGITFVPAVAIGAFTIMRCAWLDDHEQMILRERREAYDNDSNRA